MIIFELILTTFKWNIIIRVGWGSSVIWLEDKIETFTGKKNNFIAKNSLLIPQNSYKSFKILI